MGGKISRFEQFLLGFIIFIIGILLGSLLSENKSIIIDNKVRVSEIFGWFVTIFIGFFIGFKLKNKAENQKVLRTYICSDLNDVIGIVKDLNNLFYSAKKMQKFEEIERLEINAKMNFIDKKISSFSKLLENSGDFEKKYIAETRVLLTNKQIELNNFVTGDNVYLEEIPLEFFEETINSSINFEYEIKNIILQISKY